MRSIQEIIKARGLDGEPQTHMEKVYKNSLDIERDKNKRLIKKLDDSEIERKQVSSLLKELDLIKKENQLLNKTLNNIESVIRSELEDDRKLEIIVDQLNNVIDRRYLL